MSKREDPSAVFRARSSLNDLANRFNGPPQLIHPSAHPELDVATPVEKISGWLKSLGKKPAPRMSMNDPSVRGKVAEDAVMERYVGRGKSNPGPLSTGFVVANDRRQIK